MIPRDFPHRIHGNPQGFDVYASLDIVAGGAADIVSYVVPTNSGRSWITQFGHGINNPTAFETTIWSIRVDGVGVKFYDNIRDELAPFDDPRDIVAVLLHPGARISVFAMNAGAATFKFAARLRGFHDYGYRGGA